MSSCATISRLLSVNPTEDVEDTILRRMTPAQKLAVMHALWRQAWALKVAGIRLQHPTWTSGQVLGRVREIFGGAGA